MAKEYKKFYLDEDGGEYEPGDYDDDCCGCPCSPCRINPPRQDGVAEPQCCSCHDDDLNEFDEGGSG